MVTQGLTNKEIGYQLGLVEGTIKMHLFKLFAKLKVQNRTQAAVWWDGASRRRGRLVEYFARDRRHPLQTACMWRLRRFRAITCRCR